MQGQQLHSQAKLGRAAQKTAIAGGANVIVPGAGHGLMGQELPGGSHSQRATIILVLSPTGMPADAVARLQGSLSFKGI